MMRSGGHLLGCAAAVALVVAGCSAADDAPDEVADTASEPAITGDDTMATTTSSPSGGRASGGRASGGRASGGRASGDAAIVTETADVTSTSAELVWSAETTLLSQPRVAGGTAVVYQQDGDGEMTLAAYNTASGQALWTVDATPSASYVLSPPALVEDGTGHLVLALRPSDDGWGTLVALGLADGSVSAQAPDPFFMNSLPRPCFPDDSLTCFTAWSQEQQDYVEFEASVHGRTIRTTEVPEETSPAAGDEEDPSHGEATASSWFGTRQEQDGATWFTFHRKGELAWEVAADELGFDIGADGTMFGSYSPREDLVVSSINWAPADSDGTVDMDRLRTVAFDTATGEVLWSLKGTVTCGTGRADKVVPLCAGDGELELAPGSLGLFHGEGATMTGVDLHTGEEVWSQQISAQDWRAEEQLPGVVSHDGVMLVGADDPVLLDIATGQPSELDPADVAFACFRDAAWSYETPYGPQATETTQDRRTDHLSYACTMDGTPQEITVWRTRDGEEGPGVEAGDLGLIARPDRLEAYRFGD